MPPYYLLCADCDSISLEKLEDGRMKCSACGSENYMDDMRVREVGV